MSKEITEKKIINIDEEQIETTITVYYEGSKEEIDFKRKNIYLFCGEYDNGEYWIKITNINNESFEKYLNNEQFLLNIIKESNLSLYKRNYKNYNDFLYVGETDYETLISENFILPNELAKLGRKIFKS